MEINRAMVATHATRRTENSSIKGKYSPFRIAEFNAVAGHRRVVIPPSPPKLTASRVCALLHHKSRTTICQPKKGIIRAAHQADPSHYSSVIALPSPLFPRL